MMAVNQKLIKIYLNAFVSIIYQGQKTKKQICVEKNKNYQGGNDYAGIYYCDYAQRAVFISGEFKSNRSLMSKQAKRKTGRKKKRKECTT